MKTIPSRAAACGLLFASVLMAGPAVVPDWNAAALRSAESNEVAQHLAARALAMTHLAMQAAIERTSPEPQLSRESVQSAAAASAACTVLAQLYPTARARHQELLATHLAALPADAAARACAIGNSAAAEILQQRAGDGWLTIVATVEAEATAADASVAMARALAQGAQPADSPWRQLTPFAIKKVDQFEATPPYTVSRQGGAVVDTGLRRSRLFSGIDLAQAGAIRDAWRETPLRAWNRVAAVVARQAALDSAAQARLFAALNVALADASIAAEHWRYAIGHWSVVNADTWEELDGRPGLPGELIMTASDGLDVREVRYHAARVLVPPQSNFPSAAAALAGAAQAALAGFFKTDRVGFSLASEAEPNFARRFTSFSAAAREAAFAASLDGGHLREACVSGYELGARIGTYSLRRAALARG